jgi:hypothetical protein
MIGLNLVMWLLQTIDNGLSLYQTWSAFIQHSGDPLQSVPLLEGETEGPALKIRTIRHFIWIMLPGIANAVMASIAPFYNVIC